MRFFTHRAPEDESQRNRSKAGIEMPQWLPSLGRDLSFFNDYGGKVPRRVAGEPIKH